MHSNCRSEPKIKLLTPRPLKCSPYETKASWASEGDQDWNDDSVMGSIGPSWLTLGAFEADSESQSDAHSISRKEIHKEREKRWGNEHDEKSNTQPSLGPILAYCSGINKFKIWQTRWIVIIIFAGTVGRLY